MWEDLVLIAAATVVLFGSLYLACVWLARVIAFFQEN